MELVKCAVSHNAMSSMYSMHTENNTSTYYKKSQNSNVAMLFPTQPIRVDFKCTYLRNVLQSAFRSNFFKQGLVSQNAANEM